MKKVTLQRTTHQVEVSTSVLTRGDLTIKAKGLYAMICAWPSSLSLSVSAVCRVTKDKRGAVDTAWAELIAAGVLTEDGDEVRVVDFPENHENRK